jgi:hypothetical protein
MGGSAPDLVEAGIEQLRAEARILAQRDAASDVPGQDAAGPASSEIELRDRCIAFFERWCSRERRRTQKEVAEKEDRIARGTGKVELGIDRLQRLVNELIRLRARFEMRRGEVVAELGSQGGERRRAVPTVVYLTALVFLGIVEFFVNAPIFSTLLPRDPLSERQIRLLTEMSTGWLSGLERVGAHIVFHPDAALLAAGVITFLCVLAHFFGQSVRDLMMQGERKDRRHTVQGRSARENVVPVILSAVGLVLTLGVLFEARAQLGQVGAERYANDMVQVEELRREASWLRVDGEILEANDLSNRAEDMEAAALELREYSYSMARMNFPILLLNLTLVLCAISAAYFHRRDASRERFNETPFEEVRREFVVQGEAVGEETALLLAGVGADIRALRSTAQAGALDEWRSVLHHLESVLATYRAENGRARRLDPNSIAAFRTPVRLEARAPSEDGSPILGNPADYEREHVRLTGRFQELRDRFNQETTAAW